MGVGGSGREAERERVGRAAIPEPRQVLLDMAPGCSAAGGRVRLGEGRRSPGHSANLWEGWVHRGGI